VCGRNLTEIFPARYSQQEKRKYFAASLSINASPQNIHFVHEYIRKVIDQNPNRKAGIGAGDQELFVHDLI
jgi:hypothetical protein